MNKSGPIIVIEDDPDDQEVLVEIFEKLGYVNQIIYFLDGNEALAYLNKSDVQPFLILSDINMPKLNGTQILKMLKANKKLKNITVIIYSTSINHIEKEQALRLGAHSYVIKPSSYEECLEKARYFNRLCSVLDTPIP